MKAGIYVRLSQEDLDKHDKKEDSNSIKNQKDMLMVYCFKHDWEVYDIYSDDDYTGADRDRPEFNRLLEDAKNKNIDIILCKTQSRFTRELELVEKYIHTLFPIWGVRFISIVDNADTDNKGNKKARQINGLVNEWYLEDMSDSIRAVFKSKCNNGLHIGSFACYGYIKDPQNKGKLLVDEEAASIVREIFELYDSGMGQITICRALNDRGVPNPATYKRLSGMAFKTHGGCNKSNWIVTTVSTILKNEMYIGNLVQHKKENVSYKSKRQRKVKKENWIITKNTHEPIVDEIIFRRVEKKLANRQRTLKTGKKNKYAGILVCMYCGVGMYTNSWRDKRYFRCRQNVVSKNCVGPLIREDILDKIVLNEFHKLANEFLDKNEVERRLDIQDKSKERILKINKTIESLMLKLDKIKMTLKNLYLDKLEGILSQEEYISYSQSFHKDKENIEKNILINKEKQNEMHNESQEVISKDKLIEKYINSDSLTSEMIFELIEKIELGKSKNIEDPLPIKIHWKI